MRITEIDLQCEDIMWFAVDKYGHIFACTSAGEGNVPVFVCDSREKVNLLEEFFLEKLQFSTEEGYCVHVNQDNQLLRDFLALSRKGIYCFDSYIDDKMQRQYRKVTAPVRPTFFDELPHDIQHLLSKNQIDVDVEISQFIVVPHAY